MSSDTFLQFAPLIGGGVLFVICLINILRTPGISNANAAVLGLGAVLFSVPTLANFNLETPLIKWSGQVRDQVGVQGAELKRDLADIKLALGALARGAGGPAAAVVPQTISINKPPAEIVLVLYVLEQKFLGLKIQNFLLGRGYAANAVSTDFSEVKSQRREKEGTVRIVYTTKTQGAAQALSSELRSNIFSDNVPLVLSKNDNLTAADLQVQIF